MVQLDKGYATEVCGRGQVDGMCPLLGESHGGPFCRLADPDSRTAAQDELLDQGYDLNCEADSVAGWGPMPRHMRVLTAVLLFAIAALIILPILAEILKESGISLSEVVRRIGHGLSAIASH